MDDEQLERLVAQGLSAQRASTTVAIEAQDEIIGDAAHPELKAMLEQGRETTRAWGDRLARAAEGTEGGDAGENPVMEAHYEVSRRIRAQADEDGARDLGIVAAGQLALHYWIAVFGTMNAYLDRLGRTEAAQDMATSRDEAREADERHTEIARRIMAG